MIVIADTSPLNYVIQLGLVNELRAVYGEVTIPIAVRNELLHPRSPEAVRSWADSLPDWILLKGPRKLDSTLPHRLGSGEREAISLALENPDSLLLIDDLSGRIAAEQRGISFTGTLGFVFEAGLLGRVDFNTTVAELERLGFRAAESVLDRLRERFALRQRAKKAE